MMGHTKPMVSFKPLMAKVLRSTKGRFWSWNSAMNCLKPTHSLWPGKSPIRYSWKAMTKP